MVRVLDLPLGFSPPSSPPPCEQEAVRSRGSGWVWGLQRPRADRVEAILAGFLPKGGQKGWWEVCEKVLTGWGLWGYIGWGWGLGSASGALSKGRVPLPRARASPSSHNQKASSSRGTPCFLFPSSEQDCCCQGGTGMSNAGDSTVSVVYVCACACVYVSGDV